MHVQGGSRAAAVEREEHCSEGSTAAAEASEGTAAPYGDLLLHKLAVSHQKHVTLKKGLGF